MSYSRSVIPLIKPDSPHQIVGRSIIEMKDDLCKIFIWANGLQKNANHKIYFGFRNQNTALHITNITPDNDIRTEVRYDFNFSLYRDMVENFDAIVISGENEIKSVGYRKKYFYISSDFNIVNEKIEKKEIPDFNNYVAQYAQEIKTVEEKTGVHLKNEKTILFEKLKLLAVNGTEINPFERQNRNVRWARVNLREVEYLFFMKDIERKNIIDGQFKKFRHLILGHVKDYTGENFYFGVPFIYSKSQRNYFLKLGFCQFKCCDFVRPAEGEYGYWLIKL